MPGRPRSTEIPCPNCSKKAWFVEVSHDVPHFGRTLFTTVDCPHCGFRLSDVLPAEFHDPTCFTAEVKKPRDLETKIIRSSSGILKISKLGVSVEPGNAAEGFISNVEGLLDRVEAALKAIAFDAGSPARKAAEKKLKQIQRARQGKLAFTVTLSDPFGNSGMVGFHVKQRKLSASEVKKLQTGLSVLELRPRPEAN
ncbi:MAG TPA: ZPR1 zinc finger domain-containing protein [Candidatus Diapherotrites archaeon]|uniref:ZPR1 zinc finger domain-containing protein n=1 Tax=Candidatus Iainarchaeum sp. TaxID=3101447 RepID=A0A7J4JE24_9ARCH|nr:ZPR1 zinc finger domain-containing protein [Candidatus Diapherotrites archaeon]HIH16001.1 ZPR1 zinc finger domain-containing protein [Candidatus Diapherotrites archaeon]